MNKIVALMAFSLFSLLSCKASYQDLDVEGFDSMLRSEPRAQLVDVRTAEEFAAGHIAPAVNIDWNSSGFLDEAVSRLDKALPVLLYCRSGRRSAAAAAKLSKAGYQVFNLAGGFLAWAEAGKAVSMYEVERFFTKAGNPLDISLIKHGSLEIRYKGISIQLDPVAGYGKPTDYAAEFPKADVILVTHEHPDHLDAAAIETLSAPGTILILNKTSRDMIGKGDAVSNFEKRILPGEILLEAVPAYNTTPGREKFHPKGNGNGYVLTIDGFRIYVAGDTEDIPEMASLKDIDLAFLPVNQPYTMTPEQCVSAAKAIAPKVLIPYHFSSTDLSSLPSQLPSIDVRLRQMQ